VLALIGVADDTRFATFGDRAEHREELERILTDWIAARPSREVLAEFEAAHAAIAPVYTMADLLADPHVRARASVIEVDGVVMPGLVARFSATPGRVRHAGRKLGVDTEEVLGELEGKDRRKETPPRGGWE
jgi:crotonobetainyl-CoA:carnitine CoA-transferase CaiB-like acyl-CoA transferase